MILDVYVSSALHDSPGKLNTSYLAYILEQMERSCRLAFDPPKQSISAVLYWRTPEEWAEVLHEWVRPSPRI